MFSLVGEIQCSYLGHKGRCFDARVSPNSNSFITASEDGTAKIWNLESRKCVTTLKHNNKAEVLRAAFLSHNVCCTGGSDGKVIVWMHSIEKQGDPPRLCKIQTLNHRSEESQIYACEPFNRDTQIVTAADNHLYLWDIETTNSNSNVLNDSDCVQSWNFGALSAGNGASAFGGARNVDNEVYVFDAKVSPSMLSTIGVALSDASIRLLDTRQSTQLAALQTISLDTGSQPKFADQHFGHATSMTWSADSLSILVSLGSGKVAVLDTRMNTLRALLIGHTSACYGASFLPSDDSRCFSWSSDTTLRSWDVSTAIDICTTPVKTVQVQKDFPIFSCAMRPDTTGDILCGGGSGDSGSSFLGTPILEVKSFV